jgi:hypothetical protein
MIYVAVNYITSSALNEEVFSVDDREGFWRLLKSGELEVTAAQLICDIKCQGGVQRNEDISDATL